MEAYGKHVSISSFNTYNEVAASLKKLIFDAVYGSRMLYLPLFTLDSSDKTIACCFL